MCFMCWDYCRHLYRESRHVTVSMCTDYVCVSVYQGPIMNYHQLLTFSLNHSFLDVS